jgi:PAS domain S-box-containing protein
MTSPPTGGAWLRNIRFQLPAFLLVVGTLTYATTLVLALRTTVSTGLQSREQAARSSLSAVARFIADLETRHDDESVEEIIAQLGALTDLHSAVYVRSDGTIMAGTRREWEHEALSATPWGDFGPLIEQVRASDRYATDHDPLDLTRVAIPVHAGRLDRFGAVRDEGVLLVRLDFRMLKSTVRAETFRFYAFMAGCSILAILVVFVFLELRVARPAHAIARAADRAASGERGIHTGLAGHDELGRAAAAFDRMATQVEATDSELRHERALLDGLLDALPLGVFAVERSTGTVLFVNRRHQELVGVTTTVGQRLDHVDGRRVRADGSPYPAEDLPVERALRDGRPAEADDIVFARPDGSRVPVYVMARPVNLLGGPEFDTVIAVVQDRRDLEGAFARLKASEERFRNAAIATGQAVYETDLVTDGCTFSESLFEVFGWRAAEIVTGAQWNAITHRDDLERVNQEYRQCQRDRRVFESTYRVRHRAGHWVWVRDRSIFQYDERGTTVRAVGAVADITAQRELEARYQQAQKMETVGTLAGGVAHDFNNQLTGVLGHLDLLGDDLGPDDPRQQHVRVARRAAERCAELTRGLLAFSRMQRSEVRRVDVNELVGETEALLRRILPATITLELRTDALELFALADTTQIQQLLLNLCVNARDAMPNGGTLTLSTRPVRLPGGGGAGKGAPGDYVCIGVRDTGTGMAPEVRERIFEPFFTTKPVGAGTGLGLSMVYGIVTQHRGWVEVESEPGRGTEFRVYLPVAPADSTAAGAAPPAAAPAAPVSTHVLVVDDEPIVREYAVRLLERAGCRATGAGDGAEALEFLARHGGDVQAVLLDLTMPGPPVREVLREIRGRWSHVRIVVTSGYSQEGAQVPELAGLEFLAKPYTPAQLLAVVGGGGAGAIG